MIVLLAALVSICAYAWYSSRGLTFGYGDALSRMVIARRVVASRTPGLGQLGTTWLPLHTLLMLPLIWNDILFHDGFAGSFPSMAAYVIASLYVFRIVRLFAPRGAAWVAALALIANPNVAYMQSTAMSEVPMLCASTMAIYYMALWAKSYRAADLVKSAAAVAGGTGIRYDGWPLAVAFAVVVAYLAWRRQGFQGAWAWSILYGLLAFSGCVAWLIYNTVIFHDPMLFLYFGNTKHSTSYMAHFATYHHAWLSFELYGYSAAGMVGWVTAALALAGLILFVARYRLRASALPAYALLIPLAYHFLIFYIGFDTIRLPQFGLGAYWNVRFGLELIPAMVFFLGYLAASRRVLLIAVVAAVSWFAVVNSTGTVPLVLREPSVPGSYGQVSKAQGQWFAKQYRGGNVLISYVPNAPAMFYMMQHIPDSNFITDANGAQFTHALQYPQRSVSWVIMDEKDPSNRIWVTLHNRPELTRYFVLRKMIGTTAFYQHVAVSRRLHKTRAPGSGMVNIPHL